MVNLEPEAMTYVSFTERLSTCGGIENKGPPKWFLRDWVYQSGSEFRCYALLC